MSSSFRLQFTYTNVLLQRESPVTTHHYSYLSRNIRTLKKNLLRNEILMWVSWGPEGFCDKQLNVSYIRPNHDLVNLLKQFIQWWYPLTPKSRTSTRVKLEKGSTMTYNIKHDTQGLKSRRSINWTGKTMTFILYQGYEGGRN